MNYDDLDPGIREVVRWLNERGFATTDSGDGVSKPTGEEHDAGARHPQGCRVFDLPHVAIAIEAKHAVSECARLWAELVVLGIRPQSTGPEEDGSVRIELTWNPAEGMDAYVMLYNLTSDRISAALEGAR